MVAIDGMMYVFFMMYSHLITRSRKLINSKEVGRFCIPLGPVCVPGVFRLDVGVSATASASVNIIHFHHALFNFHHTVCIISTRTACSE